MESKMSSQKEIRKHTKKDPKCSKVPSKTVIESRTVLDQQGLDGASHMGLQPAQGGAYLQSANELSDPHMSDEWGLGATRGEACLFEEKC